MIDILKYKDAETVAITDVDGAVFTGKVIEIIYPEDKTDLEEKEYSIVICSDNAEVEVLQSEIQAIKIMD